MQQVENNEKLVVYKNMKKSDGAGTMKQERSLIRLEGWEEGSSYRALG